MSAIRRTRTYPVTPERLWPLLATSEGIARWLMPNDLEPRVGHRFTMEADPGPGFDGVVRGEVLEVDPPRRLACSWVGGPIDTVVTFTLSAVEGGTRLDLTHDGFDGVRAGLVRVLLAAGWRSLLARRLPAALAAPTTEEV